MKLQRIDTGAERVSGIPIILSPNHRLFNVQKGLRVKEQTLKPQKSTQELTINLPKILVCEESAIIKVVTT